MQLRRLAGVLSLSGLMVIGLGGAVLAVPGGEDEPSVHVPGPVDSEEGPAEAAAYDAEPTPHAEARLSEPDEDVPDIAVEKQTRRLTIPIDLSGYFWVDTGYMKRENARQGQYDQDANYMQGRFVLAADYRQEFEGFYAKARTEFIGFVNEFTKSQFEAHVLDAYAQVGQAWWDVQVGRFLAWEVYHRGQGIELYTAEETGALNGPALYWLQTTRGHRNEAGQAAVHFYPADFLGIEIAAVYGQEQNQNNFGVRPVVDFQFGGFQAIVGFEYFDQSPQTIADKVTTTMYGFAGKLQYEVDELLRVGANFAMSNLEAIKIDGEVDAEKSGDVMSVGGFVDLDFWVSSLGLGYHLTIAKNHQGEENKHHQAFVSYLVRLPIDGLSVKAVYGFALAAIEDIDVGESGAKWENTMHSVRLRLAYDFR